MKGGGGESETSTSYRVVDRTPPTREISKWVVYDSVYNTPTPQNEKAGYLGPAKITRKLSCFAYLVILDYRLVVDGQ